jgi:hypothetical protein
MLAWPALTDRIRFGTTVSVALLVALPKQAVNVPPYAVLVATVLITKEPVVWPSGMMTLLGTVAAGFEFVKVASSPPAGAGSVTVTLPVSVLDPDTLVLLRVKALGMTGTKL